MIPPALPNDACAGDDAGVVTMVKVTFCVVLPVDTLDGVKLQLASDGNPEHESEMALANLVPCAAVAVS